MKRLTDRILDIVVQGRELGLRFNTVAISADIAAGLSGMHRLPLPRRVASQNNGPYLVVDSDLEPDVIELRESPLAL